MSKIARQVGTASEKLNVFIRNDSNTSSAGLANIVASSVSFAWKRDDQATVSSGSCSSGGTLGTYSVSSLTQMSSTLMLGWYEFGAPDSLFVSGRSVALHMYGAPNMVPVPMEIELTKLDNQQYVSSYNISTQAGGVRVSSITPPVGVSTGTVSVSTLVGVSTLTIQVGVSTGSVNVSAFALAVGVSSFTIGVGVSSVTNPVGVSSMNIGVNISSVNGTTVTGTGAAGSRWGP